MEGEVDLYGRYIDPLSMTLPQMMCGPCGSRLQRDRNKVKKYLQEHPEATIQEAYDTHKIRQCCRTAMQSDFVIPTIGYNPMAIEGKIDVTALTTEEREKIATQYVGNMKKSPLTVGKVPSGYSVVGKKKVLRYTYTAEDEEKKIVASFTPPEQNGYQPSVTKWLEIPVPGLNAALTIDDVERGTVTKGFVLVPMISYVV